MKYLVVALYFFLIFPISSALAEHTSFTETYRQAEQLLQGKKYGEFSDLTEALIRLRDDDGYSNLVPLSEHLIEAGRQPCALGESNCSFFLKTAILLSPTDPWTLFLAATETRGFRDSLSLYVGAFRYAAYSPTFFFKTTVIFGILLLTLASLFIVLRLLFGVIRFEVENLSPRNLLIFGTLSLVGLPFGLISTGFCWAMIIFLFVGRRRELLYLLLLTLLWIAFLPTADNVIRFVSRPEERELELLLSKVSSPSSGINARSYLREPLYKGSKFYREGNFTRAKEQFELAKTGDRGTALVAFSRLATTELALKQFAEAERSLADARARGLNSYESIHNEAILAASTTNLSQSRTLVEQLREIDANRLSKASLSAGLLLEPVALGEFFERYLEPIEKHLHSIPAPVQWISSDAMLLPLCSMGLIGMLTISSIMAFILVFPTPKTRGLI